MLLCFYSFLAVFLQFLQSPVFVIVIFQ
jgi:hypothetical protein